MREDVFLVEPLLLWLSRSSGSTASCSNVNALRSLRPRSPASDTLATMILVNSLDLSYQLKYADKEELVELPTDLLDAHLVGAHEFAEMTDNRSP
jgi:hypothetical protein